MSEELFHQKVKFSGASGTNGRLNYTQLKADLGLSARVATVLDQEGYDLVTTGTTIEGDEFWDGKAWQRERNTNIRDDICIFRRKKPEIQKMSDNKTGNGTTNILTETSSTPGVFDVFTKSLIEAGKAAIPAVAAQKAIAAGTEFLAKKYEDTMPGFAAFLQSPAGQSIAAVLIPAIFMAGCSQLPNQEMAQKMTKILQPGLQAGMMKATDEVITGLVLPMAMIMINAGKDAEQITAPAEGSNG